MILDQDVQKLRTKEIHLVKDQGKHHPVKKDTQETYKYIQDKYP